MYFSYISMKTFLLKHIAWHLYEKWPNFTCYISYFCISLGGSFIYCSKNILTKNNQFNYIKVLWSIQMDYINQYKMFIVKLIYIIFNFHLYFKFIQVCKGIKIGNFQYFILQAIFHEIGELDVPNHMITFFGIEFGFKGTKKKSPLY